MKEKNNSVIRFDIKNLLVIFGLILLGYLIYLIKDIVILILTCWIVSVMLSPFADYCEKYKIPRIVSAPLIVVLIITGLLYVLYLSAPEASRQIQDLVYNYSNRLNNIPTGDNFFGLEESIIRSVESDIFSRLSDLAVFLSSKAVDFTITILDYIINIFVSIFLVIFFIIDKNFIKNALEFLFVKNELIILIYNRSEAKLKLWIRGQIFSMILIGFISYLTLLALGVEYALPLGILAGIFEIIPFIGPNLAAIPAIILGFSQSPLKGLTIAIVYFLIQQVQASIIVPKVMKDAVGLNPIVVIISILIGSRLLPPIGALIAVPIAATILIIIEEVRQHKMKSKEIDVVCKSPRTNN